MSRPLKGGLVKCITNPYLNSKDKIIMGGGATVSPSILDKNRQKIMFFFFCWKFPNKSLDPKVIFLGKHDTIMTQNYNNQFSKKNKFLLFHKLCLFMATERD